MSVGEGQQNLFNFRHVGQVEIERSVGCPNVEILNRQMDIVV